MVAQKIENLAKEKSPFRSVEPSIQNNRVATPIDKIVRRSRANRRAIEMLDGDQQDYLRRSAKAFLVARMKKAKQSHKEKS
jgi:hypothetical protein